MPGSYDTFPPLRSTDGPRPLHLPDRNLEHERSRRVTRIWRCRCGHQEIAQDPHTLRAQALAHHAAAHGPAPRVPA